MVVVGGDQYISFIVVIILECIRYQNIYKPYNIYNIICQKLKLKKRKNSTVCKLCIIKELSIEILIVIIGVRNHAAIISNL